jgi:hypothetical protein
MAVLIGGRNTAIAAIAAATTDGAIVTAIAGKRIRVLSAILSCGGTATTFVFNSKSGGAGTAVSAVFQLGINGQLPLFPGDGSPLFDTNTGEGLTATTGAGSTVNVHVVYSVLNP